MKSKIRGVRKSHSGECFLVIIKLAKLFPPLLVLLLAAELSFVRTQAKAGTDNNQIDLSKCYPTTLTEGCTEPSKAREWEFFTKDIYHISDFSLEIGDVLKIKIGSADVGIGHCADGAVWAVVIPRDAGRLKSSANSEEETIDHLWLRFHPAEIASLFLEKTVRGSGNEKLCARMQKIANTKIHSSWQAGGKAMIPEHKNLTVDVDTKKGIRRFFAVDRQACSAEYHAAFEKHTVPVDEPVSKELIENSFDQLWQEYDRDYAMFMLRPDVDWNRLREQYRPKAIRSTSAYEFALVCAEMLKNLRDLHIWIKVDGQDVPVFNRPRERNANPSAYELIIGKINKAGKNISWGKTPQKVGYITIDSWAEDVDEQFYEVLEQMRDTRGLIVDVRLNGGGSEPLAEKVAGRFADKDYIYAYSQYRNGPEHTDLTKKTSRKIVPLGPWRYDRPVIVLMGQKCMSSNESFVSMMAQCPQVTTMGDHTCGSSGNPKFIDLPAGVRVSLPRWIDLLPDGTPLDERGVQPDIYFPTKSKSFEDNRDELLKAAIEHLSKSPLPEKPISGPSAKMDKAKIISVFPPDGAEAIEPKTEIRIKFDRPMNPAVGDLRWQNGEYMDYKGLKYNEKDYEFVFAVELKGGCKHRIAVNTYKFCAFRDCEGNEARRFDWGFQTKNLRVDDGSEKPKVVAINPASDSKLSVFTEFQITFDQPMIPNQYQISATSSKSEPYCGALYYHIKYDPNNRRFTIPMILPPEGKGRIKFRGFGNLRGVEADSILLTYSTGKNVFSVEVQKRLEAARQSAALISVLEEVKKARHNIKSLSEVVRTTFFCPVHKGIRFEEAIFRMQEPKQFYADVSNVVNKPFQICSDGQNCWWYYKTESEEKVIVIPLDQIAEKKVAICDPFGITQEKTSEIIRKFNLEYLGTEVLYGRKCHLIRSWSADISEDKTYCQVSLWWIDAETYLLSQMVTDEGLGIWSRRFIYQQINQSLGDLEFRPAFTKEIEPEEPEPMDKGYTGRFVHIMDGSNGTNVCWGKYGLGKRNTSGIGGLN